MNAYGQAWIIGTRGSLRAAVGAFLVVVLSSCSGGGTSPGTGAVSTQISTWGDSTTSGIGASDAASSYPGQLEVLTGRKVYNGGVSGQTSDQIAARQGGAPALLTFVNNLLPATGSVDLASQSAFPVTAESPAPVTGTIGGIHGRLDFRTDRNINPILLFTRDDAGLSQSIPANSPFYPDTFGRESGINIFWMGQNNFYDPQGVKSDIALCIAFLSNRRFIVMSLLNASNEGIGTASYIQLRQINADLARTYPDNFVDIRELLVNAYDPSNAQDVQDHNNDIPPRSLHNDTEHLNDKGYAFVARQVASFIAAKNW